MFIKAKQTKLKRSSATGRLHSLCKVTHIKQSPCICEVCVDSMGTSQGSLVPMQERCFLQFTVFLTGLGVPGTGTGGSTFYSVMVLPGLSASIAHQDCQLWNTSFEFTLLPFPRLILEPISTSRATVRPQPVSMHNLWSCPSASLDSVHNIIDAV